MKKLYALFNKIEYELPAFLILAIKLPVEQVKVYGVLFYLLCFTAALLLGGVIRKSHSDKHAVLVFAALFLAGDMAKTLFTPAYSGASDLPLKSLSLLCFLLAVCALRCRKPLFTWSVPVLCLAGTLAWPSFLFFYLPVILILSAYENTGKKKQGSPAAFHAAWFFPLLLAGAYAVFGFYTGKKLLGLIPFPYGFKILPLRDILLALAAALPLIVIFVMLWRIALRGAADKRTKRLLALCMAEPAAVMILSLFAYYTVSDGWKYYIAAALFTWFCLLFYFLDARVKPVADAFAKTAGVLLKNPFVLLAVLIYLVKSAQIFYSL